MKQYKLSAKDFIGEYPMEGYPFGEIPARRPPQKPVLSDGKPLPGSAISDGTWPPASRQQGGWVKTIRENYDHMLWYYATHYIVTYVDVDDCKFRIKVDEHGEPVEPEGIVNGDWGCS